MKYFFSSLVLISAFISGGISAMGSNEFLGKMEGLCRLGQSVRSAEFINDIFQKSEDAEDVFEARFYDEMAKILKNGLGYNGKECPTPIQLLPGKVKDGPRVFQNVLSILVNKEEILATKMIKKVTTIVTEKILPVNCDVTSLSNSQRIAVAIIASQIDSGEFKVLSDYLVYVAINALVEGIEQENDTVSENILKKVSTFIPEKFFSGLEIIKKDS